MICTTDYKRVLNRGKSFECSKWQPFVRYTNDCMKQDFVYLNDSLFVCLESHESTPDNMPQFDYTDETSTKPIGIDSKFWGCVLDGGIKNKDIASAEELAKFVKDLQILEDKVDTIEDVNCTCSWTEYE